ncbi:MAG: ABC transporter ATP-binding protein [Firmicutes bacterium]|nr:ABC transporter ATP-binding protein [Bacillota bacterium]
MADPPLLSIKDLKVSFFTPAGEVKAVGGLSFDLYQREVIGIVGESGSGKSVSVNALMRILQYPGEIIGGTLEFNGKKIETLTEKQMQAVRGKEMAMIFQDPMTSLNPVYTVGNQLMETLIKHTASKRAQAAQTALKMLRLVGINNPEQRLKQYPYELSGGMRQRVMIAMALCCSPKLLIADEPTTALDVTIQAQILDLMKSLRNETEAAIILITHDLGIVSDICDKVIVMYGGRVVERGSTDEIFYQTAHPYSKGLLECLPRLDNEESPQLTPIEGTPVDVLDLPQGCSFAARCRECRSICLKQTPPEFTLSESHKAACWLHALGEGGGNDGQTSFS